MVEAESTPRPEPVRKKDWTSGPVLKNLLQLSWPMISMEAVYMISQIFDMVWVGRSGSASIAALGIGNLTVMLLSTVDMALIPGSRAMISRFMGAGDLESARKVAAQAYILATCWGIIVSVTGFFMAGHIMGLFGVAPEVAAEGTRYLHIILTGWVSLELLVMGLYIVQSTGDPINPLITEVTIRTLHVTLCPFLVLGLWIFPHLGIAGAALSNVISQAVGAIMGLFLLFGGRTRIKLTLKDIRFSPGMTWRLVKIGLPSLISVGQTNFSSFVLTWIVIPFGTLAVAAHSLVSNVQSFIITPNLGMGGAVGVMTGQNLGAKKTERAVRSAWLGALILEAFLVTCAIIVLIFAERIVSVFNSDPALVGIAATFLRIASAGYLVMGINSALGACINGAGDTLPNMIINIGMIWAVQIPLAYVLSHYTSLDVNGVRWAIVASVFAGVIAYFIYFRLGKWKTKKV